MSTIGSPPSVAGFPAPQPAPATMAAPSHTIINSPLLRMESFWNKRPSEPIADRQVSMMKREFVQISARMGLAGARRMRSGVAQPSSARRARREPFRSEAATECQVLVDDSQRGVGLVTDTTQPLALDL